MKVRLLQYRNYCSLCKSCAQKKAWNEDEERKLRMYNRMSGETHPMYGNPKKLNIGINNPFYGKKHSDKSKQKMSEHLSGTNHPFYRKHLSSNHCCNISNGRKGIIFTKKHLNNLSKAHIGIQAGKNHPNWQGGISYEPYCILFNKEFKERVREYWKRKCILCDKTEKMNGEKLCVHHVDYKETCCDDSLPLFVALCRTCHSKTNSNRRYWMKYFKKFIYKQDKNGKCFYTKEEMVKFKNDKG